MSEKERGKAGTAICESFCRYYRPGRNEELSCQAYRVAQRIMRDRTDLPLDRPDRPAVPDAGTTAALRSSVCGACAFRAADCDFVSTGGAAPPCGGYVLLSHLLGCGVLTLDEIEGPEGPASR